MADKQGSEVSLDRVRAVRGGHRATATKYIKEMEHLTHIVRTESDNSRLHVLGKMLEKKQQILEELDGQILDRCDAENIQEEIDTADEVSARIMCVLNMLTKVDETGNINSAVKEIKVVGTEVEDSASDNNQENESVTSEKVEGEINNQHGDIIHITNDTPLKPKLPKLTIAKFSGDVTKFQTFWDIFQNSVNNNPHMSDIDKFNYLQGLLEGNAYRAIQGLPLTQANYKAALEILQQRFGNAQMIISAHMDELLKLPMCDSENKLSQLRLIYDKVSVNTRGLEALGVKSEQYGSFLIPVIMSKLPHDICVQIARVTKAKVWNFQEILEILSDEIQAREISSFIKSKERKSESFRSPPLVNHMRRHSPTASTFAVGANNPPKQWVPNCAFCNEEHFSSSCCNVTNIQKRKEILRDTHKCFICFRTGHTAFKCNTGKRCRHCNKRHHHSVCDQDNSQTQQNKSTNNKQGNTATVTNTATMTKATKVLLQTATAYVSSHNVDQPVKVKILLDGGSQRSYITHALTGKLQLEKHGSEILNLNTFGNDRFTKKKCDLVTFDIHCSDEVTPVQALSYPSICTPLNSHVQVERYPHLEGLDLADDNDRNNIDILIGSDFYWDFVTGEVIKGDTGPVAINSKLGWILSGRAEGSSQQSVTNLIIEEPVLSNSQDGDGKEETSNDELVQQLKRFWDIESVGTDNNSETGGEKFLPDIRFDTQIQRYEVKLPWNNSKDASSSLYDTCRARLFQLRSRLQKDPDLFEEYDKIIHQQEEQGIIEEVSDQHCEDSNFLPHHGVVRADKETTKVRIVYDGSAKDRNGASLNDRLETGPNLTPHIFDILIKFRTYPVGLTADIEKAFHQISIHPEDRRKLRFLWFDDIKGSQDPMVKQYQFCRLVFGLTSSPAILNSTIHFHLDHYTSQNDELVTLLKQSLYVDDLVSGAKGVEEAVCIYKETDSIMQEGGFNFRKWKSNDAVVQKNFQVAESVDDKSEVKVLGTVWNSSEDNLNIDLQGVIEYGLQLPLTKRSILKLSAKIFDPLGLLTPFTVHFKMVFQEICQEGVEWDDPLDGKLRKWWYSVFDDLHHLATVHIPRCYFDKEKHVLCHQLHGFCDASQDAYAAVVYLRTEYEGGDVEVRIIASKTRVSPMKKQTIPRLELLGATLLSSLMQTVSTAFQSVGFFIVEKWYWTDSFTSLCWIKNSRQWKQYVQHRVEKIRGTSSVDNWRFCPGILNIADVPSRSCSGKQLLDNKSWWGGPEFLRQNKCTWPDIATKWESEVADSEQLKFPKTIVHSLSVLGGDDARDVSTAIDIDRFSSKLKLLRVTCLVMKFINLLKGVTQQRNIEAADMRFAEVCWIKAIQQTLFKTQLLGLQDKDESTLHHNGMSLFLKDGVICCWNRIGKSDVPETAKAPILLPAKHRFTELLVQEHHQLLLHSGVRQTLDSLRQQFWIPKGRSVVKRVLRRCTICRRYEGQPYRRTQLSELPEFRVSDQPPFSYTGVDYAGPLLLSNGDKAYVCLFTCASTRAVHFELCPDLSVKTFLEAFRRFVGRRGLPYMLVSDNAKTFKRGSVDIGKILSAPRTNNFLTNHQVSWEFIIERAPWWGGFWERMVQLLKRCLRKAVGRTSLSFEELRTLLVEIESTINNRPITYVYGGDDELCHALTPSDLIYGRRIASTHNGSHCDTVSTYTTLTKRVKHHFRLLTNFATSWKREYLLSLQEFNLKQGTVKTSEFKPSIGDIVIIKDEQSARCFWKLGKVVELLMGRDNLCRAANIQILSSRGAKKPTCVRRTLRQLVPIEVKEKA